MSVTAPPRPPRRPSDPVTHEEFDDLVEALIEEVRRETRRRHRTYWAVATLVAFVGVVVLALLEGGAASQTASTATARSGLPAAVASSHIAFLRNPAGAIYNGDLELWVMNPDGSGQRQVAAGARFPSWSPDGKSIAFSSERGGNRDIYVMRSDGSHKQRLTRSRVDEWGVSSWSPDGRKLLFDGGSGGASGVYVVKADGTGERRLAAGGAGGSWSPDGRTILFRRALDPATTRFGRSQLYLMNVDGSGERALGPAWPMNMGVGWSPDGGKIVLSALRNGNHDVYVINADGTGLRRLTHDPDADAIPAWSPDGRKIAFVEGPPWGAPGYGPRELWVMNADGTGKRKLTGSVVGPDSAVSWSPDSRTIAYGGLDDIYAVNADGTGRRNLTQRPGFDADPVWSAAQR